LGVIVAVSVFRPAVSGTLALQVVAYRVAPTPLTVTLLTPEFAPAVPVTVTGELVTVAPLAGEVIVTKGRISTRPAAAWLWTPACAAAANANPNANEIIAANRIFLIGYLLSRTALEQKRRKEAAAATGLVLNDQVPGYATLHPASGRLAIFWVIEC
jgi:hypothetical protein